MPYQKDEVDNNISQTKQLSLYESSNYEYLLRQKLRQEKLLSRISLKIRETLKLEEVLQTSVEEVRQLLATDRVVLYQFAHDWNGSVVVESVSSDYMSILDMNINDTCFSKEHAILYRDGRIRAINDIYLEGLASCHVQLLAQLQVRANLVIPVIRQDFLWGLLIAHHCQNSRKWEDWEIELLKQLSVQLAIAIQQAHLYEQLQAQVQHYSVNGNSQENSAINALQKLKLLLQREDICWENLNEVVEESLDKAYKGIITWDKK
ncbi:diguanylate cyclase/phosphodiesterase with GAF sensor [Nostoc carneum NIES-2107]|nr:diguanylate cyclase/phosphodiesterase with GAF sensor [Nostoc carneum NIES-2107]